MGRAKASFWMSVAFQPLTKTCNRTKTDAFLDANRMKKSVTSQAVSCQAKQSAKGTRRMGKQLGSSIREGEAHHANPRILGRSILGLGQPLL
jgi:hypothetical protein